MSCVVQKIFGREFSLLQSGQKGSICGVLWLLQLWSCLMSAVPVWLSQSWTVGSTEVLVPRNYITAIGEHLPAPWDMDSTVISAYLSSIVGDCGHEPRSFCAEELGLYFLRSNHMNFFMWFYHCTNVSEFLFCACSTRKPSHLVHATSFAWYIPFFTKAIRKQGNFWDRVSTRSQFSLHWNGRLFVPNDRRVIDENFSCSVQGSYWRARHKAQMSAVLLSFWKPCENTHTHIYKGQGPGIVSSQSR